MAEILKCQAGTNLTQGSDTSKHITNCSTGGAGSLSSNTWAQYFINVFQDEIKNPKGTTPKNPNRFQKLIRLNLIFALDSPKPRMICETICLVQQTYCNRRANNDYG